MSDFSQNALFNVFVALVFLSHCFQIVWNQPIITDSESIPFHSAEESDLSYKLNFFPKIDSDKGHISPSPVQLEDPSEKKLSKRSDDEVGSLCSIFRTFLADAKDNINCQTFSPKAKEQQYRIQRRVDVDPKKFPRSSMDFDDELTQEDAQLESENNGSIGLDEIEQISENHHHFSPGYDETKILKDKTAIIVPDRPCPHGQRRDPGGYCRTVLRFRPIAVYGQPIKYYYRKYVSVPTLHFILPH